MTQPRWCPRPWNQVSLTTRSPKRGPASWAGRQGSLTPVHCPHLSVAFLQMACVLSRPAPRRPPLSQELGVQPDFLPLPHLSPLMRSTTLTSHLTTVRGRSSSSPARPPPGWPSGPLTSPAPSGTPPLALRSPPLPHAPPSRPPPPPQRGAEEPWGELTCSVPALSEGATCASGLRLQTTGVPEVSPLPTLVPSALCPPPSAGARDGTRTPVRATAS